MYAFSFCLYNSYTPYYYDGLLENIALIQKEFPDWVIYVYIGNDVPPDFQELLRSRGCRVRPTGVSGAINMVHRFFAIDDRDIDLMMVRDADSRVHWRDAWAIRQFVASGKMLHIIRDNKPHTVPILGGLWGMRKPSVSIRDLHTARPTGFQIHLGYDQNFLANEIYPLYRNSVLIHSSISWKFMPDEVLTPFPFPWDPRVWCGRCEGMKQEPVALKPLGFLKFSRA